ncbi:MAG: MBL fold metallo-hydrolase [Opitutales bacterium]
MSEEKIPIEDLCEDIVGKAMKGLEKDAKTVANEAGVSKAELQAVLDGKPDPDVLLKIAPSLQLDGPSLVKAAEGAWYPELQTLGPLRQFNSPFPKWDMTVNSYLVWDPGSNEAVAFDTGTDVQPMIDLIEEKGLNLSLVLLTHADPDHIEDLDKLLKATGKPPVYLNKKEAAEGATPFEAGKTFEVGALTIETFHTWGHSPGGTTFLIRGLPRTVAIVGDALFAQSQGGSRISYEATLTTNRRYILSLPDDTILCPGHGPMTTVGEEKAVNPFYPEFKST